MPDPRFFCRTAPQSLGYLAEITGATLSESADPALLIEDVAPLDQAGPGHISFLDNPRYKDDFKETKAAACIVKPEMTEWAPDGTALLLTSSPYKFYAAIAQIFYPNEKPQPFIANTAVIDPTARIGPDCTIEHGVAIAAGVELGKECWIGANTVISHSIIGDNVRIYPGCCIGQDGFGFAIDPAGHIKVPQLGRVIIEDHVEIGANTTIDRGSGPDTVIGQGTWIDNLVQIGHNVRIGKGCVIVSQVGISGSTVIEDYAVLAGQVGIAGHLRIGKGARIAAKSGVMRDIPAGEEQMGAPAMPVKQFLRQVAMLNKMVRKQKS